MLMDTLSVFSAAVNGMMKILYVLDVRKVRLRMDNFVDAALKLRKEVIKQTYSTKINKILKGKSQEYKIGFLTGWELSDKFGREIGDIEDVLDTLDKISEDGEG
jgi:hypothetical protein